MLALWARAERVIVVGAGVIGLTCAVRLAEDGHRVDVLARDLPLETTSVVAAALWYPYRALPAGPGHRLGGGVVRRVRTRSRRTTRRGCGCCPAPRCCTSRGPTRGGWARCRTLDAHRAADGYADAWSFTAR